MLIRMLVPATCLVLIACQSPPSGPPLVASPAPTYSGAVTPISNPVQFVYGPTHGEWPIVTQKTIESRSEPTLAVTRVTGRLEARQQPGKILVSYALDTATGFGESLPPGFMHFDVTLSPVGEMEDVRVVSGTTVISPQENATLSALARGSMRRILPQFKAGGYRQNEVVVATSMRDFVPGANIDGTIFNTLAGETVYAGRPAIVLSTSGKITAPGKSVQVIVQGYALVDVETGMWLFWENQMLVMSGGQLLQVVTEYTEVTAPPVR
jgi:hypothetical protein